MNLSAPPLILSLLCAACSPPEAAGVKDSALGPERVIVMTYNVENLFDTKHDAGKLDYTYLPEELKSTAEHKARCAEIEWDKWRHECLSWDWSEDLLKLKLERVAAAILQGGGGKGPDILILQEVENLPLLERLRTEYLRAAGYGPGILVEGDDIRGIDVAMLSRLKPSGGPVLHKIPFSGMTAAQLRDSRGILEASFSLPDGEIVTVFGVHFPAPFHPRKFRVQALAALEALRKGLPEGRMAAAGGDFNISYAEDLDHRMLDTYASSWLVSHRFGCAGCLGSNYYGGKDEWSFLDMILLTPDLRPEAGGKWVALKDSVRVANGAPHQKHKDGTPARFDAHHRAGVSDHWPVALTLGKRK